MKRVIVAALSVVALSACTAIKDAASRETGKTVPGAPTATTAPNASPSEACIDGRWNYDGGVTQVCRDGVWTVLDRDTPTAAEQSDSGALTPSDFAVDLIVLESQCFDSAGALVTVEPDLSIDGGSIDGQATVVYEIHGGDSVETFRLELDGSRFTYDEQTIQTPTCSSHLTASVVRVIER